MIFTPDEDRGRIVENMRRRHAYAATDNIIVDFQAEEPGGRRHLMGEEYAAAAPPKLRAKFVGTAPIGQVDLVRNNEFIYTLDAAARTIGNSSIWTKRRRPGGELLLRAGDADGRKHGVELADLGCGRNRGQATNSAARESRSQCPN